MVNCSTSNIDGAANGYYMAGLAILISITSFILSKKEVSNVQTTGKAG
ncbi:MULTISPECIES: hypothetical protein [Bacillus]|nr:MULTISPECIES: hypothetical protein [unclassified Bacillus cereus group]MDA1547389.1 hypothetical protein [Bacillus cereus group sp. TH253LC]MDA1581416.1 hypothetical protein [Bacillus cereus group sp. TH228LC]MDA1630392.1 hypothetical protein [Bacillus cereus group sp. TH172LC]MDA1834760.1 hypothetical protein [Bacillus cereus group sp. BY142LC]MDA1839660.1 hypothetical protein [Bacillus cereus group sp. BY17LC]